MGKIKISDILQEIELDSGINDLYEPFREYIRNGSEGDFFVSSYYTVEQRKKLTEVPEWFTKVGGSLYLSNTKITSLPDNLEVRGDLDLGHTNITSLPNNLKVGGSLDLYGVDINSLPDNLKVEGDLILTNAPLSRLYNLNTIERMIEEKGGYVGEVMLTY